jgi:hypothetical protein
MTTTKTPSMYDLSMPFECGDIKGTIYGGPYKQSKPDRRLVLVKMAVEIEKPCDIDIPTEDYSIPDLGLMEKGVWQAVKSIADGNDIYVGCYGGIGRTGLFMGCMAKVVIDFAKKYPQFKRPAWSDPVVYVRKTFKPHAIETKEQQDFVRGFPTQSCVEYLESRQSLLLAQSMRELKSKVKIAEGVIDEQITMMNNLAERLDKYRDMGLFERIRRVFKGN